MAEHPWWIRLSIRLASPRATEAELGDAVEEYLADGHSAFWLIRQFASAVARRRSPLTMPERGAEMFANIHHDIRYAFRTLRHNPGFAVAAIVPIALGIGLNTGVFAVINSVAFRPLPVPDPSALVSVYQDFRGGPRRTVYGARALFSLPEYRTYRDEARTLSGLLAYSRSWTVTLGRDVPEGVDGILVSCNYFEVLGVAPAIGPGFTPENCASVDAPPAVVLSHALWTRAFGRNPAVLGTSIALNGRDVTVVGVAPSGFEGVDMAKPAFFVPTSLSAMFRPDQNLQENAHVSWLTVIGRRRSTADVGQVRAELALIAGRIDQEQPGRATTLIIEPAAALSLPPARRNVLRGATIVMAGFGLVLLIAATNVANIQLARATARRREIAIRLSVGATRGRLVQQLLTESVVVALVGATCGSVLFVWVSGVLIPWLLGSIPGAEIARLDATPDRTVVAFALGLTVLTALVFGLLPALQASKVDVHGSAKESAAGGRPGWMRGLLIGSQVALCTMLLIPAALLARALYAAQTFDPGFEYDTVATVSIDLRHPRYDNGSDAPFIRQWVERLTALPGIEGVAHASRAPLSPGRSQTSFRVGEEPEARIVDVNSVSPEFFSLLGVPIVRGRVFTTGEPDVVLVTESTARRYWPGQEALGQVISMDGRRRQIVGIVRDARMSASPDAMSSYMYLPAAPEGRRAMFVLVRTGGEFKDLAAAVRSETTRMDRSLAVNVLPLSNNLALLQTLSRMAATAAGFVSLLAAALAATGIYGVVAYVVNRRRREVGVRLALGAGAADVQQMIVRQTLRPAAIGLAIGVVLAAMTARLLQSVLFGVSPYDPFAFVGAPAIMLGIAAAAAFIPTRRVVQIDPVAVLRSE